MIVTAKRIPVPDPIAPIKSAKTDKAPIQRPPKAAAVGMYLKKKNISENNHFYITIATLLSTIG